MQEIMKKSFQSSIIAGGFSIPISVAIAINVAKKSLLAGHVTLLIISGLLYFFIYIISYDKD